MYIAVILVGLSALVLILGFIGIRMRCRKCGHVLGNHLIFGDRRCLDCDPCAPCGVIRSEHKCYLKERYAA